jgi:hypothetical protein
VAWQGPDQPDAPVGGSGSAIIDGYYLMPFSRLWASGPKPYHKQEISAEDVTLLTWTPGIYAVTHDVYFGTSLSDVNESDGLLMPTTMTQQSLLVGLLNGRPLTTGALMRSMAPMSGQAVSGGLGRPTMLSWKILSPTSTPVAVATQMVNGMCGRTGGPSSRR